MKSNLTKKICVLTVTVALAAIPVLGLFAGGQGDGGSGKKETVLNVWHFEVKPESVQSWDTFLDAFYKEKGVDSRIKVIHSPIPFPDFYPKMLSAIAADELPDMMWIDATHFSTLRKYDSIADVTDIYEEINKNDPFFGSVNTLYKVGDRQYALPIYGIGWPLVYRKDILEKGGLDVPKTWDDLLQNAAKTHDPDKEMWGMAVPYSTKGRYGGQVVWPFLTSNGGDVVDKADGKWKVIFNSPQTIEAYSYLTELAKYSPLGSGDMDWDMVKRFIRGGQLSHFMYSPDWVTYLSTENPELLDNYYTTKMPIPNPQASHSSTGYFRGWVVSKKTEAAGNMESIEEYFRWTYQPAHMAKYALSVSYFHFNPVSNKVAQEYMKLPNIVKYKRIIDVQVEVIKTVKLVGMARGELCPESGAIENSGVIGGVLQNIVLKNMSPKDAVAWGESELKKIVQP